MKRNVSIIDFITDPQLLGLSISQPQETLLRFAVIQIPSRTSGSSAQVVRLIPDTASLRQRSSAVLEAARIPEDVSIQIIWSREPAGRHIERIAIGASIRSVTEGNRKAGG